MIYCYWLGTAVYAIVYSNGVGGDMITNIQSSPKCETGSRLYHDIWKYACEHFQIIHWEQDVVRNNTILGSSCESSYKAYGLNMLQSGFIKIQRGSQTSNIL